MTLIACPECGTQVSSLAAACPKCAAPIADASTAKAVGRQVTTTELTSKDVKKQTLAGWALILLGLVMLFYEGNARAMGILVMIAGLAIYIGAKARGWWHHG